jgi:hypothetical protein
LRSEGNHQFDSPIDTTIDVLVKLDAAGGLGIFESVDIEAQMAQDLRAMGKDDQVDVGDLSDQDDDVSDNGVDDDADDVPAEFDMSLDFVEFPKQAFTHTQTRTPHTHTHTHDGHVIANSHLSAQTYANMRRGPSSGVHAEYDEEAAREERRQGQV